MTFPMMPLQTYFAIWWNSSLGAEIALEKTLNNSQKWHPSLAANAAALQERLAKHNEATLRQTLRHHMSHEWQQLCDGAIIAGKATSHHQQKERPPIWQKGAASLIDYAPDSDNYPILVIPSLINRANILDLHPTCSYLNYLVEQGYRPFLVEWETPSMDEKTHTTQDYVTLYLTEILTTICELTAQKPFLFGYCAGGVLALGLSMLHPSQIQGLLLCATPWDFHTSAQTRISLNDSHIARLEKLIAQQRIIPAHLVQAMFYWLYPDMVRQKLKKLAGLGQQADASTLAMEEWVNDGIGLSAGCARNFWIDWMHHNQLAKGEWSIDETHITPEQLDANIPVLVSMPEHDKIVPKQSSQALAEKLKRRSSSVTDEIYPQCGHVGMLVGARAEAQFWQPSLNWLEKHRP